MSTKKSMFKNRKNASTTRYLFNIQLHEVRKIFLRKGLGLDIYYVKKIPPQNYQKFTQFSVFRRLKTKDLLNILDLFPTLFDRNVCLSLPPPPLLPTEYSPHPLLPTSTGPHFAILYLHTSFYWGIRESKFIFVNNQPMAAPLFRK